MAIDESIWELFDISEIALKTNPFADGEPHQGFPGKEIWVYESPPVTRLPTITILYEVFVDEGVIKYWHLRVKYPAANTPPSNG